MKSSIYHIFDTCRTVVAMESHTMLLNFRFCQKEMYRPSDGKLSATLQQKGKTFWNDKMQSRRSIQGNSGTFATTQICEYLEIRDLFNVRDLLSVIDGLLLYTFEDIQLRIFIPTKLRLSILNHIHKTNKHPHP